MVYVWFMCGLCMVMVCGRLLEQRVLVYGYYYVTLIARVYGMIYLIIVTVCYYGLVLNI